MTDHPKRSESQQAAIEVFCRELAEALNDAGYEMKAVLAVKKVDVPWTQESVKEVLFKPIVKAMLNKDSTTKLNTDEVSKVYEVLDRHMSENFTIHVEFPSRERMMAEALGRK